MLELPRVTALDLPRATALVLTTDDPNKEEADGESSNQEASYDGALGTREL